MSFDDVAGAKAFDSFIRIHEHIHDHAPEESFAGIVATDHGTVRFNSVTVNYLTLDRTVAKYALMMGGWLKLRAFLGSPWIEVRYEDTVSDLESQVRRLLRFAPRLCCVPSI